MRVRWLTVKFPSGCAAAGPASARTATTTTPANRSRRRMVILFRGRAVLTAQRSPPIPGLRRGSACLAAAGSAGDRDRRLDELAPGGVDLFGGERMREVGTRALLHHLHRDGLADHPGLRRAEDG